MLQLQTIRENRDFVIERLKVKNFNATSLVDEIIALDNKRRSTQKELDDILAQSNIIAKEIGILFKQGKLDDANKAKEESGKLKASAKALEPVLNETIETLNNRLVELPNLPHSSVPHGKSAEDNEIIHEEGVFPALSPEALPHWELAPNTK